MSAPVVNGVTLALIPNNADIITSGAQYIDPRLLPGLLASAADFRAEVGRPVFVREAYRSDADQQAIFFARYYRTSARTGVYYDGSYWQKRTGASTAAVPGSSAANHRLGLCLDLWSGIDTSFTSREHLVWVRVSAKHGWVNTGRGFGEPWHQQGTPGVSPAGSTITPLPESEEDDMSAQDIADIKNALTFQRKQLEGVTNILNADEGGGTVAIARESRTLLKSIQATLNNVEQIAGGAGGIANNANATVGVLTQIAPLIVGLAGKPAGTVDVAALSKQIVAGLAPLITAQAGTLTDDELHRIATATADEQARRLKS